MTSPPNQTTAPDKRVEEIVAGLNPRQRRMLVMLGDSFWSEQGCDLRTLDALDRRGLTGRYQRNSNFDVMVTLTHLGGLIRTAILSNKDADK